jgi:hypothetical protein
MHKWPPLLNTTYILCSLLDSVLLGKKHFSLQFVSRFFNVSII